MVGLARPPPIWFDLAGVAHEPGAIHRGDRARVRRAHDMPKSSRSSAFTSALVVRLVVDEPVIARWSASWVAGEHAPCSPIGGGLWLASTDMDTYRWLVVCRPANGSSR